MPNGSRSPWITRTCKWTDSSSDSRLLDGVTAFAGRVHRERQAEHGARAGVGGRSTRHPGTCRAAADHQRENSQHVMAKLGDHGQPVCVQLRSGRRRAASRHPVGLLHQRDREAHGMCGPRGRREIRRFDPAACAVPEHQRADRTLGRPDMHPRWAVWGVELEDHASVTAA